MVTRISFLYLHSQQGSKGTANFPRFHRSLSCFIAPFYRKQLVIVLYLHTARLYTILHRSPFTRVDSEIDPVNNKRSQALSENVYIKIVFFDSNAGDWNRLKVEICIVLMWNRTSSDLFVFGNSIGHCYIYYYNATRYYMSRLFLRT